MAVRYRACVKDFDFFSRRRISSADIPPSALCLARDRSIKSRNCGLLLRDTVSMSAFLMLTKAATGLPSDVTITGSFLTFFV